MIKQSSIKKSGGLNNIFNSFLALISILIIIAISVFLLSKSFSFNARQYQRYQDNLIKLQQLDTDFNQAVLKSRYELFTSYDPLVRNLQKQESLQQQLISIPPFINPGAKEKLNTILEEVAAAWSQKRELSDRFKSRNALLKNSLRYLPLLTSQLESKFDQQTSTENLTATQVATLRSNLNKLTRNLLIYNVAIDEKIQLEIESLIKNLSRLDVEYGLTTSDFPSDLVASHTNIILNTKPQVEDLTERLITPLAAKTQALEKLVKTSYQQANLTANIYRIGTIIWFLLLLALVNYLILQKLPTSSPQFSQYKSKVKRIATSLNETLAVQNNLTEIDNISNITDLSSCRDALGDLATGVIQIGEKIKQEQNRELEEKSGSILAVQLILTTNNSQQLFSLNMSLQLKVIFEMILEQNNCQLVELEDVSTQIRLIFGYPAEVKLTQLIRAIKQESYGYLKQEFPETTKNITKADELWSDVDSIISWDSTFLNQNNGDRTLVES